MCAFNFFLVRKEKNFWLCLFFCKVLVVNAKVFTVISFQKGNFIYLSIPWTARRSNQSILKEISLEYSLEGLMLKLKLQYFVHLMRRTDSSEKTLMWERLKAGGEGEDRGWDDWMASPPGWIWVWVKLWELVKDRGTWHAAVHDVTKSRTWLSDWTELNSTHLFIYIYIYKKRR